MNVTVEGVPQLIERLRGFEKETYKVLQKEIREGSSQIAEDAKAATPNKALRNWGIWERDGGSSGGFRNTSNDRNFSGSEVRGSIKPQFRTRRINGNLAAVGRVAMGSGAGAIFALAGKTNADAFGGHINRKYGSSGPWPRLLSPAWHENIDTARAAIEDAVRRAARKV